MLMNRLETALMNNPVRALIQDKLEAKRMKNLSELGTNKVVLEVGSGNGNGAKLIKKYFKPQKIYGIDLDPKMIRKANATNTDESISFSVGDAAKLDFKNEFFDAVFDFGIIHHIKNWQDSLAEIERVLKPDGQLILEDLSIDTFQSGLGRVFRRVLDHPYDHMYTSKEFFTHLSKSGFTIVNQKNYATASLKYFVIIANKNGGLHD